MILSVPCTSLEFLPRLPLGTPSKTLFLILLKCIDFFRKNKGFLQDILEWSRKSTRNFPTNSSRISAGIYSGNPSKDFLKYAVAEEFFHRDSEIYSELISCWNLQILLFRDSLLHLFINFSRSVFREVPSRVSPEFSPGIPPRIRFSDPFRKFSGTPAEIILKCIPSKFSIFSLCIPVGSSKALLF